MSVWQIVWALVAIGLNAATSIAAMRRDSLSIGGAIAATTTGALILFFGGLTFWLGLILFFLSSTALGRVGKSRKGALDRLHAKGGRRDQVQVVANGGVAAVCTVLAVLLGSPAWAVAAAASLASANADTWASELGVLSGRQPVSILSFRQVEPGMSGGVSIAGTAAGAAGSLLIAVWFLLTMNLLGTYPSAFEILSDAYSGGRVFTVASGAGIAIAGFAGMLVDSVLGATIQAHYRRPDGSTTEQSDGNELARGLRWVTNDIVNLLSSATAAALAVLLSRAISA